MTPYWRSSDITLYCADARTAWQQLEPASVHAIVTSPPYYGLRDYGVDGQLGLEATPGEYVDGLADLLTDWAIVLRADGSLWLNLGDTYNSSGNHVPSEKRPANTYARPPRIPILAEVPNKCLLMIPERVALALIERGWILRNKVAWCKPNGMPSSATDRLATKWEYLFHFTRQPRYYYDLDAIREPHTEKSISEYRRGLRKTQHPVSWTGGGGGGRGIPPSEPPPAGVNPGDWWVISTIPNPGEHFAMFPPELIRRPILATVPEQACKACGKGRERITATTPHPERDNNHDRGRGGRSDGFTPGPAGLVANRRTVGWSDCGCDAGWTAGTVADPFAGAGTTAVMARRLGRRTLLVELNAAYCQLIARRLAQDVLCL